MKPLKLVLAALALQLLCVSALANSQAQAAPAETRGSSLPP